MSTSQPTVISKNAFQKVKFDFLSQSGLGETEFNKEVSFAMQAMMSNPLLQKATKESLLKSVINVAQSGLTLNPVKKYAYLVPRYKKNVGYEAILEPSYVGLYKLLTDAGIVKSMSCQLIYEGDQIEVNMADQQQVKTHVPYWMADNEKGSIRGGYCVATLPDGQLHYEFMSASDFEDIKQRSDSYIAYKNGKIKTCTWVSDEAEMSRKTIIKRHFKYLPKSAGLDMLMVEKAEKAIQLDHDANGFREKANLNSVGHAEDLINKANLEEHEKTMLHEHLESMEYQDEVNDMIKYLNKHQPIVGTEAFPTSQTEIREAVSDRVERDNFQEERS